MPLDKINIALPAGEDYPFPPMLPVEQVFPKDDAGDVKAALEKTLDELPRPDVAGKRIAITAGSRGMPDAVEIYRILCRRLREWGAEPFLIPAMGSHGGGTAEGQLELLAGYGITEESVGAPILSSMEVVETASVDGIPLYCDKNAHEADGIVILNKVKPHSNFKGDYESGLCKMMVIGLGKHQGATTFHALGFARFAGIIPKAATEQMKVLPVTFAVGLVENAYDGIATVEAIPGDRMIAREKDLLVQAKDLMGKLLMPSIDILIIDEIGKNISGQGMDPTVTGRPSSGLPGFVKLPLKRIIIRDISGPSHGNAAGMGMADLITLRVFNKLDLGSTYTNGVAARNTEGARMPMIANSDKQALAIAVQTCIGVDPETARIVRIQSTKKLHKIQMSASYLEEITGNPQFNVLGEAKPFAFDAEGNLID